jgi:hypothetical protein
MFHAWAHKYTYKQYTYEIKRSRDIHQKLSAPTVQNRIHTLKEEHIANSTLQRNCRCMAPYAYAKRGIHLYYFFTYKNYRNLSFTDFDRRNTLVIIKAFDSNEIMFLIFIHQNKWNSHPQSLNPLSLTLILIIASSFNKW